MRKTLLLFFFITSYWQINAQLKISTTATKLCEGTDVLFQITDFPSNTSLQLQRNGVDFIALNNPSFVLKNCPSGNYSAKALGKDFKWNRRSPDVDYDVLFDVFFVNAKVGYAVGAKGVIIKTIDGGVTWQDQKSPISDDFNSVTFVDELNGWIVGEYNTILKTTDGGKTWVQIPKSSSWGSYNDFLTVRFFDSKNGIITADYETILRTTDGGNNWTVNKVSNELFFRVFFIDANTGWKSDFDYEGKIKKTTDGGKTWQLVYNANTDDPKKEYSYRIFTSIHFLDKNIGWAVGYDGLMVTTTDGGKTWTKRKGVNDNLYFSSIIFTDANNGFAMTYGKDFLQTTDGGKTWVLKNVGVNSNSQKVFFVDSKNGWGVGSQGTIIRTTNGGTAWEKLRGNPENYADVTFINPQTGFRVGGYGLIEKTTDGGNNWKAQNSTIQNYIQQVQFFDANNGWALPYSSSQLLTTIDGGTNWKSQKISVNDWVMNYFKFIDAKNGFAVGGGTTIAKTTDGGTTWTQVKTTLDTNKSLNSMFFSDTKNGWILGRNGTILKTIDGGNTWTQVKIDSKYSSDNFVTSVFFDAKSGFILADNYRMLKTTDGGITWTEIFAQLYNVKSINFIDSKNGWVTTTDDFYRTTDGGNNWNRVEDGTNKAINSAYFINAQTAVAVGDGNTFIKYEAPTLATSNTITINSKPAVPTLAWSNSDGKLTATTTTTSPQLTWLKGVDELKNITSTAYQPTSSGSYSVRVTDGNGCSEISKAVEVTILASDNPLNESGVSVYPNPSSNGIFKVAYTRFSNEMEATMQVIGLDGLPLNSQKMVRQNNTFEGEINASNLATGIYLLQVVSGEQKAVVKISIAK